MRLSLCDDCCCGTERKHPGIDHGGIRDRLAAAAAAAGGRSRSVNCVGVCERSNVVIVRTPSSGTLWVGEVLDEPIVAALEAWILLGAPLPAPPLVAKHVFDRTARADDHPTEPDVDLVSIEPTTQPVTVR